MGHVAMVICLCNGVTEAAIRRAAKAGIRTLGELATETGCGAGCGCCRDFAAAVLDQAHTDVPAACLGFGISDNRLAC